MDYVGSTKVDVVVFLIVRILTYDFLDHMRHEAR